MRARHKITVLSLLIAAAIVSAWRFLPDGDPVTVGFVRYERSGTDWYAYMEIHNNSSRPIAYHSSGITSTHYVWDSPQIEHEGLRVAEVATMPAKSNAMFRVLVMTTEHDWRVGVDYDIPLPAWSLRLPMGMLDRASRLGIIDSGTCRAWSPRIKKPRSDRSPNKTLETNANSASLRRHRSAFR